MKKRTTLMNEKKTEVKHRHNSAGKPVSEGWYKASGQKIENIENYVKEYLDKMKEDGFLHNASIGSKYNRLNISVGTDSLARGLSIKDENGKRIREVVQLSVICFTKVGYGSHVIMRKEIHRFNRFVPTFEKLTMEVYKTDEIVEYMKSLGLSFDVHLDLNPNPLHESNKVYAMFKGYFESKGHTTEYKPDAASAMSAADYFL